MSDLTKLANALGLQSAETDGSLAYGTRKRSRMVKYWKMCDRPDCQWHRTRKGWVTIGPVRTTDVHEHTDFVARKHMTELPDAYGVEITGNGPMTEIKGDGRGRFYTILVNGGLKEFPPDQIVALGWHKIKEVYNGLTPQQREAVDALTAHVYYCSYGCYDINGERREFYSDADLARHVKAAHKDAAVAVAVGDAVSRNQQQVDYGAIAQAVVMALKAFEQASREDDQQPRRGRSREIVA